MNSRINCLFLLLSIFLCTSLYADIPQENFSVVVIASGNTVGLGDNLGMVFKYFGKTMPTLRKYTNVLLREYKYDKISFFTSSLEKGDESKFIVVKIQFTGTKYQTKDGFTIGSKKADIIKRHGNPEEVVESSIYFYNHDGDLMELKFTFNSKDFVCEIKMSVGT